MSKSTLFKFFDNASEIIGLYVITIVAATGFLVNVSSLIIISFGKLKLKFYDFLWCKVFCDCILCGFSISFFTTYTTADYAERGSYSFAVYLVA